VKNTYIKLKAKEKVMSSQVNKARNEWVEYLINFIEVWGKIIEVKKGKEAELYCVRIINIIRKLKKLDSQWRLNNSVPERNLIPVQYNSQSSSHTLQGA
jgi:hypothetical protein